MANGCRIFNLPPLCDIKVKLQFQFTKEVNDEKHVQMLNSTKSSDGGGEATTTVGWWVHLKQLSEYEEEIRLISFAPHPR